MKYFSLLLLFGFLSFQSFAQESALAKELFTLINEARTNPQDFLTAHEEAIKTYNAVYAKKLESMEAIAPAVWNSGLEAMAKSAVEDQNLDPEYQGDQKLCGRSSGRASGWISKDALSYLCDFYTNVHDEGYASFAAYFSEAIDGYAFQWGISCNRKKYTYEFDKQVDSSAVDFEALNTAKDVSYLTEVEKRMVLEVNFVRAYPQVYADIVASYLAHRSDNWPYLEKDAYDAGIELIEELRAAEPLSILEPRKCVYNAAKKHGLDSKRRGYFSHTGSDGSSPNKRILDACSDFRSGNENGAGNSAVDPRIPVLALLFDDGITSRGHRYNMLDKNWKYIGVYRYDDPTYTYFWVQNFAR